MKSIAFAGSFDPMTNGHLWIIKEAKKICDYVKIVVADNPSKKYMFNSSERKTIIEQIILDEGLEGVSVEIIKHDYVASYITNRNITHIIRGIRNSVDFDQEKLIQRVNSEILGNIQTLFVMAPSDLESVSSSFVKGLIGPENWTFYIKKFLPKASHTAILKKYITNTYFGHISTSPMYKKILDAYCAEDRYYHNLEHIIDMLDCLFNRLDNVENIYELKMAILLHDVIYNDLSKGEILKDFGISDKDILTQQYSSDEQKSAFLVDHCDFIKSDHEEIKNCIRVTSYFSNHNLKITEIRKIMNNLDLMILGKPSEIYDQYAKNIRKEYAAVTSFSMSRAKALKKLLEKIQNNDAFNIKFFIKNYKNNAILNIERELSILERGDKI